MIRPEYVFYEDHLYHFNLDGDRVVYAAVKEAKGGLPYVDLPLSEVPQAVMEKLYAKLPPHSKRLGEFLDLYDS